MHKKVSFTSENNRVVKVVEGVRSVNTFKKVVDMFLVKVNGD